MEETTYVYKAIHMYSIPYETEQPCTYLSVPISLLQSPLSSSCVVSELEQVTHPPTCITLTDNVHMCITYVQRDRNSAASSTSGSRAHVHASCPLSIPLDRSTSGCGSWVVAALRPARDHIYVDWRQRIVARSVAHVAETLH